MNKALIIVGHGSRRATSNQEIIDLTARVASGALGFSRICHAFLELATPSIGDAIDDCVAAGCHELLLIPYFLTAGRHVAQDIPQAIAAKQPQYPALKIQVTGHLGAADIMPQLIWQLAGSARNPDA